MTEQEQLSAAYSDLKDKHVRLQLIIKALKKELKEIKEECKRFGTLYWQAKDELNNIIRGRECPEAEKM